MGFFSNLFGGKTDKVHKSISIEELVKSSTEGGTLYTMESHNDHLHEVFFFEIDDSKISFRELATSGGKRSMTFDKLSQFQIDATGAVQSSDDNTKLFNEITNRETDSFYGFYFLDNKGLEKDWPDGFLVKDEVDTLVVKRSKNAKKEYTVRKNLIYDIIFHSKEDLG